MGSAQTERLNWPSTSAGSALSGVPARAPLPAAAMQAPTTDARRPARKAPAYPERGKGSSEFFKSTSLLRRRRRCLDGGGRDQAPGRGLGGCRGQGSFNRGQRPARSRRALYLVDPPKVKGEAQDEKHDGGVDRRLAEDVSRVRPECRLRHAASHGGAHSPVGFRLLREHQQDKKNRGQDEDKRENA